MDGKLALKRKKPAAPYFPPYRSIIGAGVLDFRVRNGNGYVHPTMATGTTNARKKNREAAPSGKQRAVRTKRTGVRIWPGLTAY